MTDLTSEEAHRQFMESRRGRVSEIVMDSVAERERRERKHRELVQGVDNLVRANRRFLGAQPAGAEAEEASVADEVTQSIKTVSVPDGWQALHWSKRSALAREITGKDERYDGTEADAIISAYLES